MRLTSQPSGSCGDRTRKTSPRFGVLPTVNENLSTTTRSRGPSSAGFSVGCIDRPSTFATLPRAHPQDHNLKAARSQPSLVLSTYVSNDIRRGADLYLTTQSFATKTTGMASTQCLAACMSRVVEAEVMRLCCSHPSRIRNSLGV
jgi:hypothetical protein